VTLATDDRKFLTPAGERLSRVAYVKYLRECAQRWRAQPRTRGAADLRGGNEEQARRVEERADRIERGED
jgi:hypothetical protein